MTIFCDGVRGNLTKQLVRDSRSDVAGSRSSSPSASRSCGRCRADRLAPGTVIHTLGYPLRQEEFGGGFIYAMPDGRVSVGFVVGLDYKDPLFDPHVAFQRFKQHPVRREPAARAARWCATAPRRCPKADGTRSRSRTSTAR